MRMPPSTDSPFAEPNPPPIEPIDDAVDVSAYRVDDAQRITATLQTMAARAEPVTLYRADGAAPVAGRFLRVLVPERRFAVHLAAPAAAVAGPVLLVAAPENLRVQFEAQFAWQAAADGTLEGVADFPSSLLHMQRRQFSRRETSLGSELRAEFISEGRKRVLSVDDLSLGGVGLRGPLREHGVLQMKQRLHRVRLELGTAVIMDLQLDICSHRTYRSFLAGEQIHFGCRFVSLTPRARATLEQVLRELEQER